MNNEGKLGHVQVKAVCSSTDLTRMREIALETQVVKKCAGFCASAALTSGQRNVVFDLRAGYINRSVT